MKLPICTFCAKTGMLCATCKRKLERNEISKEDVEISKILVKQGNNKDFQKVKFHKSIDTPDLIIISGDKSFKEAILSKTNEPVSNLLKKITVKPFRVISKGKTVKETITSLFSPVEVSGIDEIFVPDGSKEIRINLRGKEEDLPFKANDLQLIASKLTDSFIRFEFVS